MLDRPHPAPEAPTTDPFALAKALSGLHFIGGAYVPARSGKSFAVVNPATGEQVATRGRGRCGGCGCRGAERRRGAEGLGQGAGPQARRRSSMHAPRLIREHVEELARLIALETGKALRTESRVEAGVVADVFEFFGGLGGELKGESVPFAPKVLSVTVREPLGVVGAIIPWNVPMLLMALKVAPALVAGNAVVVKSAEEAPLAVLRICELMNRVLPPGVFNMVERLRPGMRRAAGRAPAGAEGDLHRLGRDREDRLQGGGREADPGDAGTRRQVADDRLRRLRLRQDGVRRADLHALHPAGAELHRGQPHLCGAADLRPLRRRR